MMGNIQVDAAINIANRMLPDMLTQSAGTKSKIHLMYSKREHTYDEHIKYLIEDLKRNNIPFDEKVETFEKHSDVGAFFSPWIKEEINKLLKK